MFDLRIGAETPAWDVLASGDLNDALYSTFRECLIASIWYM
jgi:hypothetical protein